jgi:pyruvate/2-oxoglutarate dehydrogenase complex dihydrolipoamide acyltransferase (E2) component
MAVSLVMPQLGESVVEGTLTRWLVKEGDRVSQDQPLAQISTDKVDTDIEAPAAGVIAHLIAHEGDTMPVGAELAVIETAAAEAGAAAAGDGGAREGAVAEGARAEAPTPSAGAPPSAAPQPLARPQPAPVFPGRSRAEGAAPAGEHPPARYSPLVLKMAADFGIDLSQVRGTGLGGRVTKRDLQNYMEKGRALGAPEAAPAPAAAGGGAPAPAPAAGGSVFRPPVYQVREGDRVEPFTRRRKIIAEHMVYSKTHSPHVGTVAEVDMTRVMRLRERHKDEFARREGFGLTVLPIAVAATAQALREFPGLNASVVNDALVIRRQINIGVAVDTEAGLVVPVIRDADQKSVLGIAREINTLARKALAGELSADDVTGGSFTVTNPGREGNLFGFAIINQPQVGILRMGEIKKTPVVIEVDGADTLAIRPIMYLALSYDHRVVDGVLGNRFLYRVARLLERGEFTI